MFPTIVPGSDTPDGGWRRSTFCGGSGCVEIAFDGDTVAVRDSKRPDSPVLAYDRAEWHSFVLGVKAGQFDVPQ